MVCGNKEAKISVFSHVPIEDLTWKSSPVFFEWNRMNDFDEKYTAWI